MPGSAAIAYCGPAAVPGDLLARWNDDPFTWFVLMMFAGLIVAGRSESRRASGAAILLMVLIFLSPLCALSSALFSVRVFHHVLLIAAVAPLLAVAFPLRWVPVLPLSALVGLHTVILWVWHIPAAYTWGLTSAPAYWLMQVSLLVSAWLLWRAILRDRTQPVSALVALGTTIAQMGLLAALIVFAPRPLYSLHFATTEAWGLSPLTDQQLAGLLMWLPASLPYLAVGLWLAWSSLRPAETTS